MMLIHKKNNESVGCNMQAIDKSLLRGEPFFIRFEQTFLHGDVLFKASNDESPDILFLHGAATSDNRNDFFLLRQILLSQFGLSSGAFDCIAHGSTGGELYDSSLEHRTKQCSDIIDACFDSQPFSIVAVGMGAYSALKLSELFAIENLILIVPEFYNQNIYSSLFEAGSVNNIRFLKKWEQTDAWSIINRFQGSLSVISSDEDKLLAPKFMQNLEASTGNKKQANLDVFANTPRRLIEYANSEPTVLAALAASIKCTLEG